MIYVSEYHPNWREMDLDHPQHFLKARGFVGSDPTNPVFHSVSISGTCLKPTAMEPRPFSGLHMEKQVLETGFIASSKVHLFTYFPKRHV